MNIFPKISWSPDNKPTHQDVVKSDLDNAIADLHQQRKVAQMANAMVNMLIARVDWLQDEHNTSKEIV